LIKGREGERHTVKIAFESKVAGSAVLISFATAPHIALKFFVMSVVLAVVFMKGLENRIYSHR